MFFVNFTVKSVTNLSLKSFVLHVYDPSLHVCDFSLDLYSDLIYVSKLPYVLVEEKS